jgi:hypothetical protein
MNIVVTGSQKLSEFDKEEIRNYLELYAENHTIHLMCYRSLEPEVLSFYIKNDHLASQLHLYTFQPLTMLTEALRESIEFLIELGATYQSFENRDIRIKRSFYEDTWRTLIRTKAELVMCFYNKDKATAVIPVDIAKECHVDAMYFDLPGHDEAKLGRSMEEKVRVV